MKIAVATALVLMSFVSVGQGEKPFDRKETLKWFTENFYGEPNAEAIAKAQIKPEIFYPEGASAEHPVPVIIMGDHCSLLTDDRACYPDVPTNTILRRGYAYVHYGFNDVAPDVYARNVNGKIVPTNPKLPPPVQPTLASWAWGFSRVIDGLEKDPRIDKSKIVAIGHSRGGKTALWAAANDERIALAVSSGSGTGGARYLHHKCERGESIRSMVDRILPHWFTPKFAEWADREQELPHDADDLLKCIYPRAVYVMSGENDQWADPMGEQIARQRASVLWTGKLTGHIGGHVRPGPHKLKPYDWFKMLDFADNVFGLNRIVSPESQGVSSEGIVKWIDDIEKRFGGLHGFVIRRHGKVIAEGSFAPYDTLNEPHMLWSHSKAFTATAIGFLTDEGKVDLDERIVDLFPDKIPANPSENLKQVRIRDLLTMNLGAARTDAENKDVSGDWEKALLTNAIETKPGTKFKYDSGATYLLACIVERKSGKKLMDYLKEKLFDPIGIEKAWSSVSPSGTACGGWGMNMTTREIAAFGQLLLDRGCWNTRRILSEGWVDLSTGYQSHSWQILGLNLDGGRDWDRGYGFQFWRGRYGYRADGAFGQFTLVIPEKDAVVSLHAGPTFAKTQCELESVWDYLMPQMLDEPLEENPKALAALRKRCAALLTKPVANESAAKPDARLFGVTYQLEKNDKRDFKSLRLDKLADGKWQLTLVTPAGENVFEVGRGEWKRASARYDNTSYEPLWGMVGERVTAVSGGVTQNGSIVLQLRPVTTTSVIDITLMMKDGVPTLSGNHAGMGGCKLFGKATNR